MSSWGSPTGDVFRRTLEAYSHQDICLKGFPSENEDGPIIEVFDMDQKLSNEPPQNKITGLGSVQIQVQDLAPNSDPICVSKCWDKCTNLADFCVLNNDPINLSTGRYSILSNGRPQVDIVGTFTVIEDKQTKVTLHTLK